MKAVAGVCRQRVKKHERKNEKRKAQRESNVR